MMRIAWLPSVAISSLTLIEGFHESWDGDLLMASLKALSLYRIRIRDNRVMFASITQKRIPIFKVEKSRLFVLNPSSKA